MSNNVNITNKQFLWETRAWFAHDFGTNVNEYFIPYQNTPGHLFRNDDNTDINIEAIISSGWDKQDFIDAIKVFKEIGYVNERDISCLEDLEKNLDKYLDMVTIHNIIT